jgi:osmotically-inducible protein OsmY
MFKIRLLLIPLLTLTLTGCAGLFLAGAATAVYVVTDPRSSSELATDQDISLKAGALGNKAPYQFNVRVTANTFRGHVLLMGQAVTQEYKDSLEAQVREIKGVKVIYNQMKVKPLLSIGEISKDTWITTKVKSALLADNELRENKLTVYTEDTEVFLTGSVSKSLADKAVDIARNISGVSKVVRAFYYGEEAQEAAPQSGSATTETVVPSTTNQTQEIMVVEEDVPFIEPIEE